LWPIEELPVSALEADEADVNGKGHPSVIADVLRR
jgi:hypothetical protein